MSLENLENPDHRFAREQHEEMIRSLFSNQATKQAAAIAAWQAQEEEKAARLAAVQIPQPKPQALPSRFKKSFLDKPPSSRRG